MAIKNQMLGIKFAKQPTKGAPKDGGFRDINPTKNKPQCPYTNPAQPSKTLRGTESIKGKLGS